MFSWKDLYIEQERRKQQTARAAIYQFTKRSGKISPFQKRPSIRPDALKAVKETS